MHADAPEISARWLKDFTSSLVSGNVDAVVNCFLPTGWLRDVLIFGWDTRSLYGRENIAQYLRDSLLNSHFTNVCLDERPSLSPSSFSLGLRLGIELSFTFETHLFYGRGQARLTKDESLNGWKALSVFMMADNLKGFEEMGPELGVYEGHTVPWEHISAERRRIIEEDPYVVIGKS
jgi:hypothetical protein